MNLRRQVVLIAAVCVKLALHLSLVGRYGLHRDEYYFLQCAENLAWGYVDHPPLLPAATRLFTVVFGDGALGLRLPAILAGAAAIALAIAVVRELEGGQLAEAVAAAAMLTAPAMLRMSATLTIPAFELLFWTAGSLLVLRLLRGSDPRGWLAVGFVAGLGLLNKHTMLVWGASLVVGLLLTPHRQALRTRWPWLGALVAASVFAPNLVWQAANGWPTLVFIQNMRESTLASVPRGLFLAGQLLYHNPLTLPVWLAGLVHLWRTPRARPMAIAFVVSLAVLLLTRAKPYYLTPAYPVLFAAGGVTISGWLERLRASHRIAVATTWLAASTPMLVLSLPVLSLERTDAALDAAFGRIVPPVALTHDMHDEFGWREQAATIASVAADLEDARTVVVATNYGEASALRYHSRSFEVPPAVSGHMNHHLWGPPEGPIDKLIVYGHHTSTVAALCVKPILRGTIDHPLANGPERSVPIFVCEPRTSLASMWPSLRHFSHGSSSELE